MEQTVQGLWHNHKRYNVSIMGLPAGERGKSTEYIKQ